MNNDVNQIAPNELTAAVHRTCDELNGRGINFEIHESEIANVTIDIRIKSTILIMKCFRNECLCADNI